MVMIVGMEEWLGEREVQRGGGADERLGGGRAGAAAGGGGRIPVPVIGVTRGDARGAGSLGAGLM